MALHHHRSLTLCAALLAVAWVVAVPATASARERGDHDRARDAVVSGQILPLGRVLERLEREQGAQVLEIELESRDGRWVYEVKLLQPDGLLRRLEVDAATGDISDRRGRPHRSGHGEGR